MNTIVSKNSWPAIKYVFQLCGIIIKSLVSFSGLGFQGKCVFLAQFNPHYILYSFWGLASKTVASSCPSSSNNSYRWHPLKDSWPFNTENQLWMLACPPSSCHFAFRKQKLCLLQWNFRSDTHGNKENI